METQFIINITITIALAVTGWIIAHYFTSKRDLRNKRLEIRTKYLIDLYHKIDTSIGRKISPEIICDLEDVISYLQLFATKMRWSNKSGHKNNVNLCSNERSKNTPQASSLRC